MSNAPRTFFYIDARGQKVGPITGAAMRALAHQGVITPETTIENEQGRTTTASEIRGLVFGSVANKPPLACEGYPAPIDKSEATTTPMSSIYHDDAPSYNDYTPSTNTARITMDYKRNRRYFEDGSSIWMSLLFIIVGILTLVFVVGIIPLCYGIYLLIRATSKLTDKEMDQICANQIRNMKLVALEKLGLDEDQVQEATPITIAGYYHNPMSNPMSNLNLMFKMGKDKRYRSSNYNATMFFFSAEQIYSYTLRFSLIEDLQEEVSEENFYTDIVSFVTKVQEIFVLQQMVKGFIKNIITMVLEFFGFYKVEKEYKTIFCLTTSGGTEIATSFNAADSQENGRSIKAMRSLWRSKKQQLK
ncbi:MAG: hypothetical protein ACRC46_04200 [Thermoguttaceae bacterium]